MRIGDRLHCPGYAVVGVETSGLSPHRHRIVEIAVAQCDLDGQVTDFFATLVNPEGPVGDVEGHGLYDDDVVEAPTFTDIAPWLAHLLRQRVVVAHNARFDIGFLEREFERRSRPSLPPLTTLCTMREAPQFLPDAPRFSLPACCEAARVPLDTGAGAAAKAMGAARLLERYLADGAGDLRHWQQARTVAASLNWPRRTSLSGKTEEPRTYSRDEAYAARRIRVEAEQARRRNAVAYLEQSRVRVGGPPIGVGEGPDSYLAVLDSALEDRVITFEEAHDLVELAASLGIDEAQRKDLDRLYVTSLAASMVAAGPVVDREERADLSRVARQLGIPRTAVDDILAMAGDAATPHQGTSVTDGPRVSADPRILARGRRLEPGLCVLFHGYLAIGPPELERRMARAHLDIAGGIHDRVDVLVVADPDESADRTYWARQRGIRVLIEPVFLALLADLERERGAAADSAVHEAASAPTRSGLPAPRTTSGFLMPRAGGQVAVAEHGQDLTEADLTAAEVTAAEVTVAEDHVPRPPRPGMPPGTLAAPAGPAPRPATPATLPSIPPPPAPGTVPVPEAGHPSGARTRVAGPGTESGELPAAGSATPGPTAAAQPDVPAVPAAPTAPVVPDEPPRPASTPPAQPRALVRGQAVTIAALGPFRGTLRIEAAWSGPQTADADVIVLVLDDNRRVGGDGDLVFYNQPVHPSEAVRLAGKLREGDRGADSVDIDTSLLPGGRSRVLVALALDTAAGAHTFADVPATVAVVDPVTRRRLAEFRLSGGPETVMILTEVYSRNDEWRLRAVGQGYAEGLAALVTEHGVVVEGE